MAHHIVQLQYSSSSLLKYNSQFEPILPKMIRANPYIKAENNYIIEQYYQLKNSQQLIIINQLQVVDEFSTH